ncbi:zinc finger BED domain-containing protein RICESLEEPER 2-like [Cicer arietinum]|uniref:zinc finger BED domain-containing protein RICESLEEPER 2-like n=1 Tax=Cicer arietinum TaxID=3827 RepID=UPI003CC63C13
MAMKLEEVLREWGPRNVSTVTVDNASSIDVAVRLLKKKIIKNMNGLLLDVAFFHMRCCAHILNLVVTKGLKDFDSLISSIQNVVRFVRSSQHKNAKFKEYIEFTGIASNKLLCLDVQTRWNSTYLMLEAVVKFKPAFDKLEDEDASCRQYFVEASPPTNND